MKRVQTERAIAIILSLAATGCARFPTDKTAPINQTARFFGVGWSDGYHECNSCYRQGNLLAGRMGCGHCGVATCNGCGGESNYLVQQFTPQTTPANPPAVVPPAVAPPKSMNEVQPIVPPKSNAPMPPMMMSPLLPEAVPTKTEKSRSDANKSLLTEPAEVVEPERADPPSPSDKKGTRLRGEEELKPKQSSETIEFPTPGDKSPKVDDDDLLSYVPRTPQNMVYHSAPSAAPRAYTQPMPYGVQPMPNAAQTIPYSAQLIPHRAPSMPYAGPTMSYTAPKMPYTAQTMPSTVQAIPSMPVHTNANGPQLGIPAPYAMPMNAPTPNAFYGYAVLPQAPVAPVPGNIPIPGTGRLVENPYVQQATRANGDPNRYQMAR